MKSIDSLLFRCHVAGGVSAVRQGAGGTANDHAGRLLDAYIDSRAWPVRALVKMLFWISPTARVRSTHLYWVRLPIIKPRLKDKPAA